MYCYFLHCALASGTVYCNRSCLCVYLWRVGGRCPNLTTASARIVFASLWVRFSSLVCACKGERVVKLDQQKPKILHKWKWRSFGKQSVDLLMRQRWSFCYIHHYMWC